MATKYVVRVSVRSETKMTKKALKELLQAKLDDILSDVDAKVRSVDME